MTDQHPAHQLHQVADDLAKTNLDHLTRNRALVVILARLIHALWFHGDTAHTRAADWAGPLNGTAYDGDRVSSSGSSSPTETAALTPPSANSRLRTLHSNMQARRIALAQLAEAYLAELTEAHTTTRKPARETTVDECAEPTCTDPAIRHGRCEACAKYRTRWLTDHPGTTNVDIPPVPSELIADRAIRRRRKHISA